MDIIFLQVCTVKNLLKMSEKNMRYLTKSDTTRMRDCKAVRVGWMRFVRETISYIQCFIEVIQSSNIHTEV